MRLIRIILLFPRLHDLATQTNYILPACPVWSVMVNLEAVFWKIFKVMQRESDLTTHKIMYAKYIAI